MPQWSRDSKGRVVSLEISTNLVDSEVPDTLKMDHQGDDQQSQHEPNEQNY